MAEPIDNWTGKLSYESSNPTAGGVVIDLGTGDGRFVYQSARRNPHKFYIGIDAQARQLEKISEKIHRKPQKGGLANVMFVQAAVEDLPSELDGVADELHIHFPWGSLLGGVASGDQMILASLRRVLAPGGWLELIIGMDPERDRAEMERLGLGYFSAEFLEAELTRRYTAAGFDVLECGVLEPGQWPRLETTWAHKLSGGENRRLAYLIARAAYS
ncbi:MAG TPA: class I SAM-dependent methyltransferase [Blastocatellia bacterium]|nr:class I SAM-dependent methyltransferase [Blastocatellia bacterium]